LFFLPYFRRLQRSCASCRSPPHPTARLRRRGGRITPHTKSAATARGRARHSSLSSAARTLALLRNQIFTTNGAALLPQCIVRAAQHFLNLLPDPHGHGSLRPTLRAERWVRCALVGLATKRRRGAK